MAKLISRRTDNQFYQKQVQFTTPFSFFVQITLFVISHIFSFSSHIKSPHPTKKKKEEDETLLRISRNREEKTSLSAPSLHDVLIDGDRYRDQNVSLKSKKKVGVERKTPSIWGIK
ncbi:hypothetical protein ACOSQ3_010497 [Xanthoceras sorbifolium]